MSDSYDSENDRRHIVVPIIAIALCVIAIIGIGYALTTSVSNNGNDTGGDNLSVNLFSDESCENVITSPVFGNAEVSSYDTTVNGSTTTHYVGGSGVALNNDNSVYLKANQDGTLTFKLDSSSTNAGFSTVQVSLAPVGGGGEISAGGTGAEVASGISVGNVTAGVVYEVTVTASWNGGTSNHLANTFDVTFSITN